MYPNIDFCLIDDLSGYRCIYTHQPEHYSSVCFERDQINCLDTRYLPGMSVIQYQNHFLVASVCVTHLLIFYQRIAKIDPTLLDI